MEARSRYPNAASVTLLLTVVMLSGGCVSLAANLIHVMRGSPAEYPGLKDKRVAVVCITDKGFAQDEVGNILTLNMQNALLQNVKNCKIVHQKELEKWAAATAWQNDDFVALGKGVEADRVVLLEIKNLRLRNGQTLYRGVSDVSMKVLDTEEKGGVVYSKEMLEFAFPIGDGAPATGMTESKFRSYYLKIISDKLSGVFYARDATADYALDATVSSL